MDWRARVGRAVEAGMARRAAAAKYEVSISFVVKLMQRWRWRGTGEPDRIGGGKRSTLAAHAGRVHAVVAAAPDLRSPSCAAGWRPKGSTRAGPAAPASSPPRG